jgi:hypothetical protein
MDPAEEANWLRVRAGQILRRYGQARRWMQMVFVLGAALVSGGAGSLAKLLGPPEDSWPYIVAILAAVLASLVSALFLDEGAMEVASHARGAIPEAEKWDQEIGGLADQFPRLARLHATPRALREYLQSILADGETLRGGPTATWPEGWISFSRRNRSCLESVTKPGTSPSTSMTLGRTS